MEGGGHTLVMCSDMPLCFLLPVSWLSMPNPSEPQALCTVGGAGGQSKCSVEALTPKAPRQDLESHPTDIISVSVAIIEALEVGCLTKCQISQGIS